MKIVLRILKAIIYGKLSSFFANGGGFFFYYLFLAVESRYLIAFCDSNLARREFEKRLTFYVL